METKRIYPSTQLIVALDARVLKVYLWILSWSSRGDVKYYPKQFAKACKMSEEEVDRCIEALVNVKLVDVSRVDSNWMLSVNAEQNQKYYDVPISKVLEGNGIMMADSVTWNKEESEDKVEKVSSMLKGKLFDMSEEDMRNMMLMLQAHLKEKQEVKKVVVSNNREVNDLPF